MVHSPLKNFFEFKTKIENEGTTLPMPEVTHSLKYFLNLKPKFIPYPRRVHSPISFLNCFDTRYYIPLPI
jgi:hypothetical protein